MTYSLMCSLRPKARGIRKVGKLLGGAFEATGERLHDFNCNLRVLLHEGLQIGAVVFDHPRRCACFDRTSPRAAQNIADFAENGAGVDEHVEHDVVFIDLDGSFFQNIEAFALFALFKNGLADSVFLDRLHTWYH